MGQCQQGEGLRSEEGWMGMACHCAEELGGPLAAHCGQMADARGTLCMSGKS